MSELSPPARKVRMTKTQMKKYLKDMELARQKAQKKLDIAKKSGDFKKEEEEVEKLEKLLNNDDFFIEK
ncbi:hypothetical protein CSB08_00260 [Candidatus Gracilibacteria bacterium]|nr:MAG: hypothetical protein CSB08_00260 [Candidatus Gracilibacteria bacterium]PIE85276.1 MAG: hypothetical protein CSA08_02610 [Candidatus Gracilibacteria bacterium]